MRDLFAVQIQESSIDADLARCVLPRVKVIGPDSVNGRVYLPETLRSAVPLYEGASVNTDHPDRPQGSRSVFDRLGWLSNCRAEADGIYGDLHYNPKHPYAEQLVWWAKNNPSKVGLSHNAIGTGKERPDGVLEVTKIVEVKSVDLVADPATVKGLYESRKQREKQVLVKIKFRTWMEHVQAKIASKLSVVKKARLERCLKEMDDPDSPPAMLADTDVVDPGDSDDPTESLTKGFKAAISAIIDDDTLDAKAKAKKIKQYLTAHEKLLADDSEGPDNASDAEEEDDTDDAEDDPVADKKKKPADEGKANKKPAEGQSALAEAQLKELDELRAREKVRANRDKAVTLCKAAKLPEAVVTDYFLDTLAKLPNEAEMKACIEDRRKIANVKAPVSSAPANAGGSGTGTVSDAKDFAKKLFEGTGIRS